MSGQVLGLPLEQAEAVLRAEGVEPEIVMTAAPGNRPRTEGTLRVIRRSGRVLTVASFPDGMPKSPEQ